MFNILFKDLEDGEQLRERPGSCGSVVEMIGARPLCPNSRLLDPTTECYCSFLADERESRLMQALTRQTEGAIKLEHG